MLEQLMYSAATLSCPLQERAAMLGTRPMSDVLSSRLADVLPPKQPNASVSIPPPFALERGFAEARH